MPVPIACNYHPWESAFVLPRDNPYAAVTKMDGTFTISKLPVGELEFQVWHEKIGYLQTPQWTRGRFKMAWIGLIDTETLQVKPVANMPQLTIRSFPAATEQKVLKVFSQAFCSS